MLIILNGTSIVRSEREWYHNQSSTKLILITEDKKYEIGDDVIILLYLFDKSNAVHASEKPIVILNENDDNERKSDDSNTNINIEEKEKGIYEIKFKISSNDVEFKNNDNSEYIDVNAKAIYGKDSENDLTYNIAEEWTNIDVKTNIEKTISLSIEFDDIKDIFPSPGDSIEFTITVEEYGKLANKENLKAMTKVYQRVYNGNIITTPITNIQNPSIGKYTGKYTIDTQLNESIYFNIFAYIDENNNNVDDNEDIREEIWGYVYFYRIWYHELRISDTSALFEICVSDIEGKAISNLDVNLTGSTPQRVTEYNNTGSSSYTIYNEIYSKTKKTNNIGKTIFELNFENTSYIRIEGIVGPNSKKQKFIKIISMGEQETPGKFGFDIIEKNKEDRYNSGSNVNIRYNTYYNGTQLNRDNDPVYWYAYTEHKFIETDIADIKFGGELSIDFIAPDDSCTIDFIKNEGEKKEYDGATTEDKKRYSSTEDSININKKRVKDSRIYLNVSDFEIGKPTKVEVLSQITPESLWITWALGEYDSEGYYNMRNLWNTWQVLNGPYYYYFQPNNNNELYQVELVVPEFMPKNLPYTIYVIVYDENSSSYRNYQTVNIGKTRNTSNDNDNKIFELGIFQSILIGILVFIIYIAVITIEKAIKSKNKQNYKQFPIPQKKFQQSPPKQFQ